MARIKKILVVCTGNACRSPIAEAFLRKYLKPEEDFEIISTGISALSGLAPTPEAIEAMEEKGIDISLYMSTPFSKEFAKKADIILVMGNIHKAFILEVLPEVKDKIHFYKEFAGIEDSEKEILDPIGQPISVYRKVRDEIKKASIEIAHKIKGGLSQ